MGNNNDPGAYTKGFVFGALIGGAVGAVTALLFAPKPGAELRRDLAEKAGEGYDKASEYYDKANDYYNNVQEEVNHKVRSTVNEGKMRAQSIVESAKHQADELIADAESVLQEAKSKASHSRESVQKKINQVKDATVAGVETFKEEMNNNN